MAPLLEVKNLKTHFFTADGVVKAVDGISYDVAEGEVVGFVGVRKECRRHVDYEVGG